MKIKTLLLTTTLFVSSVAFADASAHATKKSNNALKDVYAKAEAGLTMPSQLKRNDGTKAKFDKGFTGGIGGGYRFNEFLRSDVMFHYRKFNSKKLTKKVAGQDKTGKVKYTTYSAMLNGYLDAHNDTIFTPYVMAGFGINHVTPKSSGEAFEGTKDKSGANLIWNAGLGCQAKVYENISLDLGYKYVDLGTVSTVKKHFNTHEVLLGLVYDL